MMSPSDPDMDGYAVCATLKADPGMNTNPANLLTASPGLGSQRPRQQLCSGRLPHEIIPARRPSYRRGQYHVV